MGASQCGKNQRLHGKLIRHCMYLMDDVVLAWLAESGREELSDEYHMNWQQIFDAMETLTQLRLCIDDSRNETITYVFATIVS